MLNCRLPSLVWSLLMSFTVCLPQLLVSHPIHAADDQPFTRQASWEILSPIAARKQLEAYFADQKVAQDLQKEALSLWPDDLAGLSGQDLLDLTISSLAKVEPRLEEIRIWCAASPASPGVPAFTLLAEGDVPAFLQANAKLFLARTCIQRDLADECVELLADIKPEQVVDPAGLLFHRAVAHHRLLQKEQCLQDAKLLLENEAALPARYVRLCHLMADDIRPLKTDSLDEVSRMMEDVRRRLDHARAGTKVREEEDEIVAKLDKMIEQLEEQQKQQQQQQQAGQAGGSNPSSPAQDSTPGDLKGPGNVDIKDVGKKSGWGNLPAKERQEVLQQIGKELPAHFRETIEEYFQRLAQDGVK